MRRRREKVRLWQESRAKQQNPTSEPSQPPSGAVESKEDSSMEMKEHDIVHTMGEEQSTAEGVESPEEKPRWTLEDDEEEDLPGTVSAPVDTIEELPALPEPLHVMQVGEEEEFKLKAKSQAAAAALSKPPQTSRPSRWETTEVQDQPMVSSLFLTD